MNAMNKALMTRILSEDSDTLSEFVSAIHIELSKRFGGELDERLAQSLKLLKLNGYVVDAIRLLRSHHDRLSIVEATALIENL